MYKNEEIIQQLKKWVKENYDQRDTVNAFMIKPAGYVRNFLDGRDYGRVMAAYEIGCILGMEPDLEKPFGPVRLREEV